jgi:hypothetical protein
VVICETKSWLETNRTEWAFGVFWTCWRFGSKVVRFWLPMMGLDNKGFGFACTYPLPPRRRRVPTALARNTARVNGESCFALRSRHQSLKAEHGP